ncbi:YqaI family protein [Lysinibacillus xylanilyticus]|uniref:YqaI family protein n=1 Tax=Lysinibacillus xylanilyticus TaxID=582475 RepID=UPI003D080D18
MNQKPPTDMFGKEIKEGDAYFVVNDRAIHLDSMEDYFIEVLGATVHKRKKTLTAGTVNDFNKSHQ